MKKNNLKKRLLESISFFTVALILIISVVQAGIKIEDNTYELTIPSDPTPLFLDNDYFTWEDDFLNAQQIDKSLSENYIIEDDKAKMYGTYLQWADPLWTRMKIVTLQSSTTLEECAIKLIVDYDSDMQTDYDDIRFKLNNDSYWISYWIEEKNPEPNNPYAIIWIKISLLPSGTNNVYMFYGNSYAEDQSDYWAVFDEQSWEKKYVHDHQVTYHWEGEGTWDPDVAYGADHFLVTWEEGTPFSLFPPMLFQQQIRGCFYDEDGEISGSRFDITSVENPPYRYENPSIAYGSDESFFVAFEHYTNPINNNYKLRDIEGAIVSTTGSIYRFDICFANGIQADPCVAFDNANNRFFVIWEDGREGTANYNIYGGLYDLQGNRIGVEKIISTRPNTQCEPWVVFDNINDHYMVVWEEGMDPENGPFDIWGQLFDMNGNALGSAERLSPQGTSTQDYNFPCVGFCSLTQRFLCIWQEDDISSNDWHGHIWGKILDENGNVIVDTFKIAHGEFERTDVVSHLSSSFFVAYDGGGDVWGKLVSSEGDVNPYVLQLSDTESDPADWVNIGSSGEKIFASWEDTRIIYPDPYEALDMPDVFANVWSFNTPSDSDVTYTFLDEQSLVLEACITSIPIAPENWMMWHEFHVVKTDDISFDILDGESLQILKSDISSGSSIQSLSTSSIRLKARFNRNNPSSSPALDKWNVSYIGRDDTPPLTTIDNIDGVKGLNEWYTSEGVTLWFQAEDLPKGTGIGVDSTYYTLNDGSPQIYNEDVGLQLIVSQSTNWMGLWEITFWSVDRSGNAEDKNKPENNIEIKIDADKPYIKITEPADEQEVETPFWIRANASDNAEIEKVEFDIEPFGEREGLPYVDDTYPYEWNCDVEKKNDLIQILLAEHPLGVNVMVRAQVYDQSGQTWMHEVWVHIANRKNSDGFENNLCFVVTFGSGVMDISLNSAERYYGNTIAAPSCIVVGDINWQYSNGFCFSVGANGMHSIIGEQSGSARLLLGVTVKNSNIFMGIADKVNVYR